MGSYSITCCASGLGISGDTEVCVVPLTRSNINREEWRLRAPPVRARYNDYGGIIHVHPDDEPILALWARGLSDAANPKTCTLRGLIDRLLADGRVDDQLDNRTHVRLSVVRLDVWQELLALPRPIYVGNTEDLPPQDTFVWQAKHPSSTTPVQTLICDHRAYLWSARRLWDVVNDVWQRRMQARDPLVVTAEDPLRGLLYWSHADFLMPDHAWLSRIGRCVSDTTLGGVGIVEHLLWYAALGEAPKPGVLDAIGDLACVTDVLAEVRVPWRPVSTFGPQYSSWAFHDQFLRAIQSVVQHAAEHDEDELGMPLRLERKVSVER